MDVATLLPRRLSWRVHCRRYNLVVAAAIEELSYQLTGDALAEEASVLVKDAVHGALYERAAALRGSARHRRPQRLQLRRG